MVGHDHGMKIPSPDFYKVENYQALIKHQERLAREGLKDPWIRNYAWRYQPYFGTFGHRATLLLTGWKIGLPLCLLNIGFDYLWGSIKGDHDDNGKHH